MRYVRREHGEQQQASKPHMRQTARVRARDRWESDAWLRRRHA